jgi:hypothetical protein
VYCVLLSIIFNFLNFVCSRDTRRWIKSKNTICLILIYHHQNPTEKVTVLSLLPFVCYVHRSSSVFLFVAYAVLLNFSGVSWYKFFFFFFFFFFLKTMINEKNYHLFTFTPKWVDLW